MTTLHEAVSLLSNDIRDQINVSEDGKVTAEKGLYEATLAKAGLDADVVKKVYEHNNTFVSAAALVVGEKSIEAMKTNKDLDTVTGKIPTIGRDAVSVNFVRQMEARNIRTGETSVVHGNVTAKMQVYATGNTGDFADVKSFLRERAKEALA